MKKLTKVLFLLCLVMGMTACSNPNDKTNLRQTSFNNDWKFYLGDAEEAVSNTFDDSNWRTLNLPHDWAIEGDFSDSHPSGNSGGALPGGIGWYRKTFTLDKNDQGKKIFIDFDGVHMNSTVYLNGEKLGFRPFGYISFSYDLTPYLKWDEPNVITVKVDNSQEPNSRWYSGCGIYRNVWLRKLNPVHIAQWGTYVTTPQVSKDNALVRIQTTIQGQETATSAELTSQLIDKKGQIVAETSSAIDLEANNQKEVSQEVTVANPTLWSIEDPYMYEVKSIVKVNNQVVDTYNTPIGIRSFEFDAKKGFFLNGEHVKINGVCIHHDLGCLGAAFNTRAMERNLQTLKEMGCNGIRCSHNPPAPELLDLCDRMGFIVMDEAFDMWYKKKAKFDYGIYFPEWHERDLTDLVVRDRNHPSVFMWSIGNEVIEQWTNRSADDLTPEEANFVLNFTEQNQPSAEEEGLSFNSRLTQHLADIVRKADPTRPITAACNFANPDNHLIKSGALDIIGYNYNIPTYDAVPEHYPDKPFIVTESVSGLATRGYYRMPSDSMFIWPQRNPDHSLAYIDPSYSCSAYDNCHVPWGSTQEEMWKAIKNKDYISGQYIWTGIDYIGEPTPYPWPARSSYFGIIDLAGFPKDVYYMYQSEWRPDKQVLHLYPHWNWEEGQDVDMWAYYNNADEVELFVNGKSQGIRHKEGDDLHVSWRVKFEPGNVKAVSRKDGKVVATQEIRTAGEPAQVILTPDRTVIKADGTDLSFITVEIQDRNGNLCPNADNDVTFKVAGNGFIAGVDNGCQTSMERFKDNHRKAFYGKCLLVVQNDGKKGVIQVKATSPNLGSGGASIVVK